MTSKKDTKKKDYDLEHMPRFIKEAPWYMDKNQTDESKELFH